jgi:DNA-binding SARP family transcriptional activator
MAKLSVSLLGGFSVTLDGRPVTSFESNKVRALLAYLVTEADRAHSRDKLAALLWPDMPDQTARSNLRYALSNLRKAIGDVYASQPILCISKQTVQLNPDGNLDADVLTFSRQLTQSPLGLPNLEEAMRVYQGDFLDGFYIGSDSAFEEWVILKREQLRRQALETLHHLAQAYRENGDLANALTAAWHLVDLEPWSEESHRELMLLLGLSGRRAAALSQYETCRRVLAEELNVEPSMETTRIYEQIRDGKIKPLTQVPEQVSPPAENKPGPKIESPSGIPESKFPNRDRQLRWLKVVFAGLLVVGIAGAITYYFINHSKAAAPTISPVFGEVVGRCFEQILPRICITNAQTGLVTQVAQDLPIDNLGPGFAWSPDGTQIVFSGSKKPALGEIERAHLYVINKDGTNLHQITNGDTNDILPAWSPDGTWIAFHGNCTLWIVHPNGTERTPLSSTLCATSIAWSPDSRWIAFLEGGMPDGSRPATIRVFEQDGKDSRIVYTFSRPVNHGQVAWSPDGQQIFVLYNTGGNQDNTILLDAQGQGALKQGIEIPLNWMSDFYPQWGK